MRRAPRILAFSTSLALALGSAPGFAGPPKEGADGAKAGTASETPPRSDSDSGAASAPGGDPTRELRAAILPLAIEGEITDADRALLTEQLVEGLRRGRFALVAPDEVSAAVSGSERCDKRGCFEKVGKATGATHVVRAVVKVVERDYDVTVTLIDPASGLELARSGESCEICGVADAGGLLSTASATLRTKLDALASGPASLDLVSTPEGALVTIDGEIAGVTPLDMPVVPGKKVIRISAEGYIAIEREVTFVEGISESLSFELEPVPSRLPGSTWGWVSLGVGAAGLGTGIAFTHLHGRENRLDCSVADGTRDAQGNCKFLWDTKWAGTGTAIAGAALLTLGVAILINSGVGRKKARRPGGRDKAELSELGVGPGSVVLGGRF